MSLNQWKERDPDASPQEIRQNNLLAESYETGKISKALKGYRSWHHSF